jgi:hypothetical protein
MVRVLRWIGPAKSKRERATRKLKEPTATREAPSRFLLPTGRPQRNFAAPPPKAKPRQRCRPVLCRIFKFAPSYFQVRLLKYEKAKENKKETKNKQIGGLLVAAFVV